MAEFLWKATPPYGVCNSCGTSASDKGFVDMIGDVTVKSDAGDITGYVESIYCGACIEQAARLFGCVTKAESEEFAYRENDMKMELTKTKDELAAWQQRFLNMANLTIEDFENLKKLENPGGSIVTPPGS